MSFLFPKTKIPGQKLGDLETGGSTYGTSLLIVKGADKVNGVLIWVGNPTTHVTEQETGGKGGGGVTTTTYSYSCSFAYAFTQNQIKAYRRIWFDNKIGYDVSDTANIATLNTSAALWPKLRMYYGTETQLQDSLMVAKDGALTTPAYRGVSYIVFDDLDLSPFNNRIPGVSAEVVENGHVYSYVTTV